ncbi:MAG: [glutamine synthetase] adenylyltransferase / [glutamine synthetase]-adenylyl-L-tyrosine [Blastocatellia bacterium]|jgi:glutamate-ammonia-ligase adenylyltransferase|nr:[glutamine synthetase] adenylyltransferase / [glutamine synthetase]-adenylyl-L-tyrosine [Blastocatellia bacterium]
MRVAGTDEMVEQLLGQLPESHAPRLLFNRLVDGHASILNLFKRQPGLLSDVLAIAAWSPLLATTLEQDPDYISWLQRERVSTRVRTREEMGESLARFALTNSQLDPHVLLARFRRRELLRTYLHDIRRVRTIVETTEELSNLADAILDYALQLAKQQLDNLYGSPQITDARGRSAGAEFCIVALGKLGSRELNYASDIDLVFLFSDEGQTSTGGSRGQITNREYFVKLAESLLRLVSEPTGEGAAYRIDVRLRPHGRDGALASGLDEAARYYDQTAQDWELQTLIRARPAAGSQTLYARFAQRVLGRVFRSDISVTDALTNVRLAKQNIDRQRERQEQGFNVKLGRGGIREIEFIAQALQIAFGGRDPWLRAAHTLISLGRLAERGLITDGELSQLSDAYHFWRALEHRLQMEHGLQTHSVPTDRDRRELVARRMNFSGEDALRDFESALTVHATNVRASFDRIFGQPDVPSPAVQVSGRQSALAGKELADPSDVSARLAAAIFLKHLAPEEVNGARMERGHPARSNGANIDVLADELRASAEASLNPQRALSFVTRVASSLDKENEHEIITRAEIEALVKLCGASEFFGEMVASRTALIHALTANPGMAKTRDYLAELSAEVKNQSSFRAELDALRRKWSGLLIEIGAADAAGDVTLQTLNRSLTELAVASIDVALDIARREFVRRYQKPASEPRLAVLGLGRLGSAGMDYGSDLDVVIVYDSSSPSPVSELTHDEAYVRLAELIITALSSITREGYLYRVDLRLRPDGQKGSLVNGAEAFITYLQKRASIWEWLAYVKLRAVAGDLEFGRALEASARQLIHELAHNSDHDQLRAETHRVRNRLEKEKVSRRSAGLDIKHGPGGMLDVYFAVRYLQLRDNVKDDEVDRTTAATLRRLSEAGSLDRWDFAALNDGYTLLRSVDHQLRLIVGRSARLPPPEHPAFLDIARRAGYQDAAELTRGLSESMSGIRSAYARIMNTGTERDGS